MSSKASIKEVQQNLQKAEGDEAWRPKSAMLERVWAIKRTEVVIGAADLGPAPFVPVSPQGSARSRPPIVQPVCRHRVQSVRWRLLSARSRSSDRLSARDGIALSLAAVGVFAVGPFRLARR